MSLERPDPSEYDAYYRRYADLVPDGDILQLLRREMETTQALLAGIDGERERYRYAPGKWSLREVVGHLVDTERVFASRALWIARAAEAALPSMEQDAWAEASNAGERPLAALAREWQAARTANVLLFEGIAPEAWTRRGLASGFEFTARAFPWILLGHELYHRAAIRRDYLGLEA